MPQQMSHHCSTSSPGVYPGSSLGPEDTPPGFLPGYQSDLSINTQHKLTAGLTSSTEYVAAYTFRLKDKSTAAQFNVTFADQTSYRDGVTIHGGDTARGGGSAFTYWRTVESDGSVSVTLAFRQNAKGKLSVEGQDYSIDTANVSNATVVPKNIPEPLVQLPIEPLKVPPRPLGESNVGPLAQAYGTYLNLTDRVQQLRAEITRLNKTRVFLETVAQNLSTLSIKSPQESAKPTERTYVQEPSQGASPSLPRPIEFHFDTKAEKVLWRFQSMPSSTAVENEGHEDRFQEFGTFPSGELHNQLSKIDEAIRPPLLSINLPSELEQMSNEQKVGIGFYSQIIRDYFASPPAERPQRSNEVTGSYVYNVVDSLRDRSYFLHIRLNPENTSEVEFRVARQSISLAIDPLEEPLAQRNTWSTPWTSLRAWRERPRSEKLSPFDLSIAPILERFE